MGSSRVLAQPQTHPSSSAGRSSRSGSSSSSSEENQRRSRRGKASRPRWPQGALQVVEAQLGLLSASCSGEEFQQQQQPQRVGDDQSPSVKRTRWGGGDDENRSQVHIDLQPQQPALPYGWEQFLDINTGEVYYIDWSTCKRTCRDPRQVLRLADDKIRALRQHQEANHSHSHESCAGKARVAPSSSSSSGSAIFPPQEYHQHQHQRREDEQDKDDEQEDENENEASSSRGPRQCSPERENVMVALGCHHCLTYFMLPRLDPICPSCGARLGVKH